MFRIYCIFSALLAALALAAAGPAPAAESCVAKAALRPATLTGFTRARTEMTVVSEQAGKVLQVMGDVGDEIGKSGVYASLDDTYLRLDLDKNRVEQARLTSRIAYLTKEVNRYRALLAKQTAAQSTLDQLEQELDQARHELMAQEVEENVLRENLSRHAVAAPRGWTIIERLVEPGEWVAKGEALGRLGDFRTLHVPLALTVEEFAWVKAHDGPVDLVLPDLGKRAKAVLAKVSPSFDPETRKINVELAVKTDSIPSRGGIRAELTVETAQQSGAVLLAKGCVLERYDEHFVLAADGTRVPVVVLGNGPGGTLRVSSPRIKPGDEFQAAPTTP